MLVRARSASAWSVACLLALHGIAQDKSPRAFTKIKQVRELPADQAARGNGALVITSPSWKCDSPQARPANPEKRLRAQLEGTRGSSIRATSLCPAFDLPHCSATPLEDRRNDASASGLSHGQFARGNSNLLLMSELQSLLCPTARTNPFSTIFIQTSLCG